jgi:CHAD domain-containing protein
MAYEISFRAPLRNEFRRIAGEQVLRSIGELEGQDAARGIHESRKRLKRLRSLLRLARPAMGPEFATQNARFRDAARALSGLREARVLGQTAAALAGQSHRTEALMRPVSDHFSAVYAERVGALTPKRGGLGPTVAAVVEDLSRTGAGIEDWPVGDLDVRALLGALTRGYRAGRRAMLRTASAPTVEAHHQWRKHVQRHWHHMRLVRALWPEAMLAREQAARELSELLGRDHDLAVLAHAVGRAENDEIRQRGRILDLIRVRQAALREEAYLGGRRLYAERPRDLRRRLEVYWRTAELGS